MWKHKKSWLCHFPASHHEISPWHNRLRLHINHHPLNTWRRHQMETFSALLAICAENSPVPGEFTAQRPVTRSFDVFFDLRLNKLLSKQAWGWWFEMLSRPLWRHCNRKKVYVILVRIPASMQWANLFCLLHSPLCHLPTYPSGWFGYDFGIFKHILVFANLGNQGKNIPLVVIIQWFLSGKPRWMRKDKLVFLCYLSY